MNNFLNELSNYLKNNLNHNNGQVPLLNHILSDNKLTTANENCLRDKFDETLIQFAKGNFKNDTMYFVQDNKKSYWSNNSKQYDNDVYTVLKIHEDDIEEIDFEDNTKMKIDGVFIAQGVAGSTDFAKRIGAKVNNDKIVVDENMQTSIKGLFACGDCTGGLYQVSKAVYEGTKAGLAVLK